MCAKAAQKSSKKGEITNITWNCFIEEVGLEVNAKVIKRADKVSQASVRTDQRGRYCKPKLWTNSEGMTQSQVD